MVLDLRMMRMDCAFFNKADREFNCGGADAVEDVREDGGACRQLFKVLGDEDLIFIDLARLNSDPPLMDLAMWGLVTGIRLAWSLLDVKALLGEAALGGSALRSLLGFM